MVAQTVHPPRPVARIIPVPGATAPASVLSLATRTFTYSREYVRVPLYTYSSRYYMHVGRILCSRPCVRCDAYAGKRGPVRYGKRAHFDFN